MSWPVRSRQLVLDYGVRAAGYRDLGTVPAGKTWLLKDLEIVNSNNAAGVSGFYVYTGVFVMPIVEQRNVALFGEMYYGDRHVVLIAGQVLRGYVPFNGTWGFMVSGAQLG